MFRDKAGQAQRRNNGQFGAPIGYEPSEHDKLNNPVSCKVSGHEVRRYEKLFDTHRKIFGWQCNSDMYRDLLDEGCKVIEKMITNLDPMLVMMREQSDEREAVMEQAMRHTESERTIRTVEEEIDKLIANRDFGAIRKTLKSFVERTRRIKDPVIKARRMEEYEKRGWDRMSKDLSVNISMDPDDFGDEDTY